MPTNTDSRRRSRRSFIATAGTALSAPLAVAAAAVPAPAAVDLADPGTRLARLEDLEAIRGLNQSFARYVNSGERAALAALFVDATAATIDPAVRGLAVDRLGEDDAIEVAPDRQSATALLHRMIDVEDAIGPNCPLVEMAREQGGGVVRRSEPVLLETAYVKREGVWKIAHSAVRPATIA